MASWTTDKVREVSADLFSMARSIREDGREVATRLFLFFPTPGDRPPGVCPLWNRQSKSKDEYRAWIAAQVQQYRAQFVAHVSEAWVVGNRARYSTDAVAAQAWIEAGHTLADFPGRQEIIHMTVDGPGLELAYMAEIMGPSSVGPTQVLDATKDKLRTEGRMTNLSNRLGDN